MLVCLGGAREICGLNRCHCDRKWFIFVSFFFLSKKTNMQENLTPLNVSLVLSRACRKLCLTKKTCSPIFEKQFPPPFHIYQHPRIFFSCNPIVVVGVMLFMQFIYILRYFSTTFSFFISSLFSYLVRERKLIINGTIFFSITFFKIKRMFSLPLVIDLLLMTVCPFIIRGWQTISTFFSSSS